MFPCDATPPDVAGAASDVVLIRHVRVFDGTSVADADSVLVRDGVITDVGIGLQPPADAELVDGDAGTLLPGLIDAHTHALAVDELEQALAFGVTTELDMFCVPDLLEPLRTAVVDRTDVADLRSAGIGATVPGGHPTQLIERGVYPPFPTVTHADEADAFVAARVREGSDYLKVLIEDGSTMGWGGQPQLDPATITALITAAHTQGLRVVAHVSTQTDAQHCVAAGVDGLAHLFVDQPPDPAFVQRAAAGGVFAIPTITIFEMLYGTSRRETDYINDPELWPYLDPALRTALRSDWREHLSWQPPDWASAEHTRQATRLLHQAGVPILAGTDVAYPRAAHGLSLHAELAALVDAGLSPTAALTAATAAPAAAFGLGDRGRIVPGLRADLLLVNGDPTDDITATTTIAGIWRNGQRFEREAYRAVLELTDTPGGAG